MKNSKLKTFLNPLLSIILWIVSAFLINFIIESIARGGVSNCYNFLTEKPIVLFYNSFFILLTLSITFLFKRRIFVGLFISLIWIILGISNGVILKFRGSPLTGTDFSLIKSGLSIIDNYFSTNQIIILILSIILLIGLLVLIFIYAPKSKIHNKVQYILDIVLVLSMLFAFTPFRNYMNASGNVSTVFWNINDAYTDYGFPYCLYLTTFTNGIEKPDNYGQATIDYIVADVDSSIETNTLLASSEHESLLVNNPNVLVVQLESFFDLTLVENLTFSQDPIPNFRHLMENYSSGFLGVSCIGGGTANTEFEVLTGMNIDFFSPSEFPYNTILHSKTAESIAYTLKEKDYSTAVFHNYSGLFYNRNVVFSHLGFDSFTPLEFMNNVETTPIGWPKDKILTNQITELMQSTDTRDFIFTVSVQGHGGYPTSNIIENPDIIIEGLSTEEQTAQYEYYAQQLFEMDQFVADLINAVNQLDEPTIIAFYGDHLPSLGLSNESVLNKNIFQTNYVIWDNLGLEKVDKDIETYQLSAVLLDKVNLNTGLIGRFHIIKEDEDSYLDELKLLQYDMLYGNQYQYLDASPYPVTNLQMGYKDITISDAYIEDNYLYVKGENFTPCGYIYINGSKIETEYIDENTLRSTNTNCKESDEITICFELGNTPVTKPDTPYIYK